MRAVKQDSVSTALSMFQVQHKQLNVRKILPPAIKKLTEKLSNV